MKLLHLSTLNLNSLYGEQEIDFERDLSDASLFMIVGPTGAGKTTVLDAIALALFGQTPRLRKAKSSDPEEDARNVIARGTTQARATLVFRTSVAGEEQVYRASWSCGRTKRDQLQDPVRSLQVRDAATGEWRTLIESKKKSDFQPRFDEVLQHLTVEDFKRCVLLAQGEFAAFVQATEDERAALLERLTDTSAYQLIGARAAERRARAAEVVRAATQRLDGVPRTRDEEIDATVQLRETAVRERAEGALRRVKIDAGLRWLDVRDREERARTEAQRRMASVQARSEAHRKALAALEAHDRVAMAFPWLDEVAALARRERDRTSALGEAEARVVARTEEEAEAHAREGDAMSLVARVEEEEVRTRPALQRAFALHERVANARAAKDEAEAQQAAREVEWTAATTAEETVRTQARVATTAFDEAAQRCTAVRPFEPIVAQLPLWRERAKQIDEARVREARWRAEQHTITEARARIDAALAAQTEAHRAAEADVTARAREVDEADAAVRVPLGEHTDPASARAAWLADAKARSERRRALSELQGISDELARLEADVHHHERTRDRLAETVRSLDAELRENQTQSTTQGAAREALRWALEVARERGRLVPGEPCPLCGSRTHDAAGPHAEDAERAARAHALDEALARLAARRDGLTTERATWAAEIERANGALATLRVNRTDALARRGRIEAALHPPVAVDAIASALEAIVVEERVHEARLAALARAEEALHTQTTSLRSAQTALHTVSLALERGRTEREVNEARHAQISAQRTEGADEAARREVELRGELRALGVERSSVADSLGVAQVRADEVTTARGALDRATLARKDASTAQAHAHERLERATEARRSTAERLVERRASWDAAVAEAQTLFDGAPPHEVEERLARARREAVEALRVATHRTREATQARGEAAARLASLREEQDREGVRRAEVDGWIDGAVRDAGLPDRAALAALRLGPDEHAKRIALRRDLEMEGRSASDAARAADLAWETHLASRPGGLSTDDARALHEERAALDARESAWADTIAAANARLVAWEQARVEHASRIEDLARATAALDVWKRLHELIGVDDGNAFRKFAQTLNLEDLLSRANEHLARLAPRYALVPSISEGGAPRLAFAVRDAFHPGKSRPLVTLSGGETFLVSLALALGLASYREVRLPIGTLLLDEGFGMLDPDTLDTVVTVLERLGAQGVQVGVVSHVAALAERIDARIVVEPQGHGHSVVRVERGPVG